MVSRAKRMVMVGFVLALVAWAPTAHAKADLLKRSAGNIFQAPLDFLFAPYTSIDSLVQNYYRSKRKSTVEKIVATPLMAVIYVPSCGFMSTFIPLYRALEGAAMLVPGMALAGTDFDMGLYLQVHGKRGAVVDKEPFYFGARYCEGFFK